MLLASERTALNEYRTWLGERFGLRLRQAVLFGSRARGEGNEESDLDVLVVVDEMASWEGREAAQQTGDLLTRHGVVVSSLAISTADWDRLRRNERLIVREIERDGIPL